MSILNKGLRGYWTKGVVGGNIEDLKALGSDRKGVINPLFTISMMTNKFIAMADLSKSQLQDWSKGFVEYTKNESVKVNGYYGEAIKFCHALSTRRPNVQDQIQSLICTARSGRQSHFYLMEMAEKILSKRTNSVLYTETFHRPFINAHEELYEVLFMDTDLASLVLGVTPIGYVLGRDLLQRLSKDVGQESLDGWSREIRSQPKGPLNSQLFSRYHRMSFATLAQHAMRNLVKSGWTAFIGGLRRRIRVDTTSHTPELVFLRSAEQFRQSRPLPIFPMYIFVTLVMPRKELEFFNKLKDAPGIHLDVARGDVHNNFFAFNTFFARIKQNKDGSWDESTEDPKGWGALRAS
ncbi:hypothetical protein BDZ45DRAFT_753264 [Acephala macrosclerotiorum]|nr:hypothetical protein BDZ45DRAFT_753264 [Acephala macrosclerotiorum]